MSEQGRYTRKRIGRIVDDALRRAGVLGVVPTPFDTVAAAAGVHVEPMAVFAHADDRPLLGALWFEERTLFLEQGQSSVRRRFTQAHELMHALCPWHRAVLRTDTATELFGPTRDAIEAEANTGAALLVFGGSAFAPGQEPLTIADALSVASRHVASVHATLHHCVQADRGTSALVVAGRFRQRDGSLPVWRSVESPSFRRRFGSARALVGDVIAAGSPLSALAAHARTSSEAPTATVRLGAQRLAAQAHDNRHAVLVLLRA
jgi:hypothetical protein